MKKLYIILAALLSSIYAHFSVVYADTAYIFSLSDGIKYSEGTENWSIDLCVPEINGMSDDNAQMNLNTYFRSKADELTAEYNRSVSHAAESIREGNNPNFVYQYYYEIITDDEDFFVFKTTSFFRSSSATESSEYWTLDKTTGQLLDFSDVVKTTSDLADIREQIFFDMLKFNNDVGAPVFKTGDDSLNEALRHVGERHHWYFDEFRRLVITFDKYEIGPAILGSPEFPINHSTFYYMH